jgi:uncharacterized protein
MKSVKAPPDNWDCEVLISRIPRDGSSYSETFDLPLEDAVEHWGQEYVPLGPVSATIESSFANGKILTRVSVLAGFSVPCSRCLSETGLAITGELRYLFASRPLKDENSGEDPEDGDADVISLDSFQAEIDFVPYVWETLLLHLPERAFCKDDCKGLCPICGQNRNEADCCCGEDDADPRLAVLRNLDV